MLIAAMLAFSVIAGYCLINNPKTVDVLIGECRVRAEIADTHELRTKGLSGRKRLQAGHGMLFVFDFSRGQSFWMKDTSIPLSIAFISHEGMILQIEQMKPFDLNKISSDSPAQYALEVNQGFFKENGITVGMQVDLSNVTDQWPNVACPEHSRGANSAGDTAVFAVFLILDSSFSIIANS